MSGTEASGAFAIFPPAATTRGNALLKVGGLCARRHSLYAPKLEQFTLRIHRARRTRELRIFLPYLNWNSSPCAHIGHEGLDSAFFPSQLEQSASRAFRASRGAQSERGFPRRRRPLLKVGGPCSRFPAADSRGVVQRFVRRLYTARAGHEELRARTSSPLAEDLP